MAEDQVFSTRVAGQHAVAAFEAIAGYARERLRPWTADGSEGGREPAQDHYRLSGMLCALRHLADKYAEISFRSVLEDSNQEYRRQRADPHPILSAGTAAAARAIDTCHRSIDAPTQFRDSAWPPDALAGLREYAAWAGQGFPAAIASITGQLTTDLWHYADRQHIDIGAAMTAADQAYASHRLAGEGAFQTGLDLGQHPAPALTPSPAAPASGLIATRQGIVTSFADAEWLLVRTAARVDYQASNAPASSYEPDEDDLLALSRALGGMCGQSAGQIIRQLIPQIEARIAEIERGPDTAAELGREHGQAGTGPFCDLDIDGDATALMHELGETEPMTGANYPYRLNLVTAYAQAYQQASMQGPAAAASPPRIAAESFPHHPGRPATSAEPTVPDPVARRTQARPDSRLRRGPTR
jgi:hypothetical protein